MRKLAWKVLFVLAGAVGLYVVLFPITYGLAASVVGAFERAGAQPAQVEAPEPPLDGDNTMTRLVEIAGAVEWEDDSPCPRDAGERDSTSPACRELALRHATVVADLDVWAADPYGPRHRDAVGRHAHAPVAVGITVELPQLSPQLALVDLLTLAAEQAYRDGEDAAGAQRLRLGLELGSYFETNPPTLLHAMVGIAVTNEATTAATRLVPGEGADLIMAALPAQADRIEALRMAVGSEWLNLGHFLDHELRASGPFAAEAGSESPVTWLMAERVGLYDAVHTRQMHDAFWTKMQASLEPPLGSGEVAAETWDDMGPAKYFHNPVGRLMITIAIPGFQRFGGRAGSSIDRVAALRVVLAARQHFAQSGRWPDHVELPVSAVTGKPLHWDRERQAIVLYAEEGDGLCGDPECVVPFARAID